ncbi:MAG: biotin/lipoyl-binding protein [Candidatus Bathyarchaeota archaeon]|jgi:biotin carboxyl carrier protein
MNRKFKVTIDGKTYTVEVEEIFEDGRESVSPEHRSIRPHVTFKEFESLEPLSEGIISAPLPGVVSEIRVEGGESVVAGQVLIVLEAMKMANEIYANAGGIVEEIYVKVGEQVKRGAPLVRLS